MEYTVKDRFLQYVQVDTQADPTSGLVPSTAKQLDLIKIIESQLTEMGIPFERGEDGSVYAHIPKNTDKENVPGVFFCSHVDTAPDCSGTNVKPIIHPNYQGGPIVLPDDPEQIIDEEKFPELAGMKGQDIITASGLTLLGADDKSGVACIMDAAYQMVSNPAIKHGPVSLYITTDEEIGKGVSHVKIDKIGADFGYTLDSGPLGHFEYENFSANGLELKITGVSAHPGYAKGKMENAIKILSEIIAKLPKEHSTPESTDGKGGFVHPGKLTGELEKASAKFIIRDFDTSMLAVHEKLIHDTATEVLQNYPGSKFEIIVTEQYRNMKDVVDQHMHIVDYAVEAMENLNIPVKMGSIRGGTDGAVLSHLGLPCPNLFSGQHGIHSKLEWTSVQEMQKAVDTVIEICRLTESKA